MASFLTGLGTSELTGLDSVLTGAGVCAPNPDQFITDGASFLTGKESVLTAAQPLSCAREGCLAVESAGLFTLTDASGPALILATFPYDFACSPKANIELAATVDSKLLTALVGTPIYPHYGIFVVTVVPPAADLFALILPDVNIPTTHPVDHNFHTFAGTNTIANPGPGKTIIFAVVAASTGSSVTVPEDYQYQNFILDVTGI